jgi:hypothetical protein
MLLTARDRAEDSKVRRTTAGRNRDDLVAAVSEELP